MKDIEKLVDAVIRTAFIPLEASGRHVHVTKEQALKLFGHDLTEKRPLSQPGQYLCNERVTVEGPKGKFQNVAVLGPARKEAQVEISLTDGRTLGITPPVRLSGDVKNTPGVRLVGPNGQVELENGVIAAKRHIHICNKCLCVSAAHLTDFNHALGKLFGILLCFHESTAATFYVKHDILRACGNFL